MKNKRRRERSLSFRKYQWKSGQYRINPYHCATIKLLMINDLSKDPAYFLQSLEILFNEAI